MGLKRTQYEYLAEDSEESVVVTIKLVDRLAVYRQLDGDEIAEGYTVLELRARFVHAACVRMGLTDLGFDEWWVTVDEFAEVGPDEETDEPGEAGATSAT